MRARSPVEDAASGLPEERAVALVPNHRVQSTIRIGRFRCEREARCRIARTPFDRAIGLQEVALEIQGFVADVLTIEDVAPLHVEGEVGGLRVTGRKHSRQAALQIVIVGNLRGQVERGLTAAEMDVDGVVWHEDRPKQTIRVDVRVVIVNLTGANWTGKEIESDEPKCRVVMLAIHRDVLADHEPHVRLVVQRVTGVVHARSADPVQSDEPVEVGDLRRLMDVGKRRSGSGNGKMVNQHAEGRNGKPIAPCGSFNTRAGVETIVHLSAAYSFHGINGWIVTREVPGAKHRQVVLSTS